MKKMLSLMLAALVFAGTTLNATGEVTTAEYPGEIVQDAHWREKVQDGYLLSIRAIIWEPVELDQDYLHPANSDFDENYIIEKREGYNGANAWAIPFVVFPSNSTEGFGGFESYICIGLGNGSSTNKTNIRLTGVGGSSSLYKGAIHGGGYENNALREKAAYFMTVAYDSHGMQKSEFTGSPIKIHHTLDEDETEVAVGYFYFIDRSRTPDHPSGLSAEDLGTVYIAMGSQLHGDSWPKGDREKNSASSNMFIGQGIAMITIGTDGKLLVQRNPDW